MPPRLHVDTALAAGSALTLPPAAARHAQVLRLQPGDALTLFDGRGGEWSARIDTMGKRDVRATALAHHAVERELPFAVTIALAMPSADRMDFVVEKATELGVAAFVPLLSERSVLRLASERAEKRRAHWQAVALAACEQCGRNRVPTIHPVMPLPAWLATLPHADAAGARLLLAWRDAAPWTRATAGLATSDAGLTLLSGPEGGFSHSEEDAARAIGFAVVSLGARVLRADTAPLAALAALALGAVS
jgi:16S rRNA (uracil1498-N3)-methyltransferase